MGSASALDTLKASAEDGAEFRQHALGTWQSLSPTSMRAYCLDCGMYVDIDTKPEANGIDIGGTVCGLNCPTPSAQIAETVETLSDGSFRINASRFDLIRWANKAGSMWPCSTLADLQSVMIKFDAKGDLVELGCNPEYINAERVDIPADELSAYEESVRSQYARREIIRQAIEIDSAQFADYAHENRPGRYEGTTDKPLTVAMDILCGISGEDEQAGSVEYGDGHAARFDRFILWTSNSGFRYAETFDSVSDAEDRIAEIAAAESEDYEPDGEDGFISSTGPLGASSSASFAGKHLGTFADESAAEKAIRDEGISSKFWPNVWRVSDHGNHHLIEDFWRFAEYGDFAQLASECSIATVSGTNVTGGTWTRAEISHEPSGTRVWTPSYPTTNALDATVKGLADLARKLEEIERETDTPDASEIAETLIAGADVDANPADIEKDAQALADELETDAPLSSTGKPIGARVTPPARPAGICPDCGKPITLQLSGWWTHDGLPGDCWRQSMDGPNLEES